MNIAAYHGSRLEFLLGDLDAHDVLHVLSTVLLRFDLLEGRLWLALFLVELGQFIRDVNR